MVSQSIAMFGTGSGAVEPDIQAFGNKGANLVAMASIGLPIPPGCIINTSILNPKQRNPRDQKCITKSPLFFSAMFTICCRSVDFT